jgi:gas vesicle protein
VQKTDQPTGTLCELSAREVMTMANDNGGGFLTGMICGAAVGAGIALLFAPKSGANMRRDLSRASVGLRLQTMDMYDNASATVSDLADRGTEVLNTVADAAKKASNKVKDTQSTM